MNRVCEQSSLGFVNTVSTEKSSFPPVASIPGDCLFTNYFSRTDYWICLPPPYLLQSCQMEHEVEKQQQMEVDVKAKDSALH